LIRRSAPGLLALLLLAFPLAGHADEALPELSGYEGPVEDVPEAIPEDEAWEPTVPEDARHGLRVASWNIKQLGASSSLERRGEVLGRFDLVAIQEILDPSAAVRLLDEVLESTRKPWALHVAPRPSSDTPKGEFPAYLYRQDRICPEPDSAGYPSVIEEDEYHRMPYYHSFRLRGSGAVITLVNVHLRQPSYPVGQIRAEVELLADVHEEILETAPEEDAILIAGDFNLNGPSRRNFGDLFQIGYEALIVGGDTRTTYRARVPDRDGSVMTSFYDNLLLFRVPGEYLPRVRWRGVLYIHEEYFDGVENPIRDIRRTFSDHAPVWVGFSRGQLTWGPRCPGQ